MARHRFFVAALALACLAALASPAAGEPTLQPGPGDEHLVYEWRLEGFKGVLLRLVAPGRGEGSLITVRTPEGNLSSELHISAERRREGEYWLYGSEVDPRVPRTVRAWSEQLFRGKPKARHSDLDAERVIDVTSGILLVRRDPPQEIERMRIWSNGRLYPVEVRPAETGVAELGGESHRVRRYEIRGVEVPGERLWTGAVDLVLADDPSATPVEIFVANKGVRVRLLLDEDASRLGLPGAAATASRR